MGKLHKPLQTRVFPSKGKHTRTLIYLHGMDCGPWCYADYEEWFSIPGLRVVLPGAEKMYVDLGPNWGTG